MGNMDALVYLLLGVAGLGVLLALVVMIAALVQRGLDEQAEEIAAYDEDIAPLGGNGGGSAGAYARGDAYRAEAAEAVPVTAAKPQRREPREEAEAMTYVKAEPDNRKIERDELTCTSIGGYSVRHVAAKHIGARKEQQDALLHSSADAVQRRGFLSVICDGMGGMRMGAEAANAAAAAFVGAYVADESPAQKALRDAVDKANGVVWDMCKSDDLSGAGTTLVAALITPEGFHYISVGDSHVYLYRKGVLSQLNVDHNYLSELLQRVRRGEITREEALSDPERAHLTSYLGIRKLTLVDRSSGPIEIEDGDRILLASDGLFKVLTPADISAEMANFNGDAAERLIGEVLKFGYRNQDNMSVAIIALDKAKG